MPSASAWTICRICSITYATTVTNAALSSAGAGVSTKEMIVMRASVDDEG